MHVHRVLRITGTLNSAIVPYLALSIAGLSGRDAEIVRAAYLSLELIG